MTVLKFEIPGPDAPGFLRRQRQALEFSQKLTGNPSPETLDSMVEFLAQFVTEPEEHDAKIDALWEASENQFMQLLNALRGETDDENPTA